MIFIHPITIIYIVLGIMTNRFNLLFSLYSIALIHEMSHILVAKIFKLKINYIVLYPTGFQADIENLDHLKPIPQILVIIAGPLSYFITLFIANYLLKINTISVFGYQTILEYNFVILVFNLLPLYPLDGGKLLDIILATILDEKITRIVRSIISFFVLIIFASMVKTLGDLTMFILLVLTFISTIKNFKKDYFSYLIKRKFEKFKYPDKINNKLCIYRYKNNWFLKKSIFYNEQEIIKSILENKTNKY